MSWIQSPPGRRDLIAGFVLIIFFYLNFYKLLPALYFNGKKTLYFLIVTVCFIAVIFIPHALTGPHDRGLYPRQPHAPGDFISKQYPPPPGPPGILGGGPQFFLFLSVFLFSMGLAMHERWRLEEKERIRVELHYLKSQINPHFLFNAMNGIYSLTLEKSEQAPKAVLMLSSMMRYVFSRDKQMLVPLTEEIEYISNYISLQRLRFGNEMKAEFISEGDPADKMIAPMILVPLVENAFKHGVNAEADSFIRVRIMISEEGLEMEVFNLKVPVSVDFETPGGIGIQNTKNRLGLQYPGTHSFTISDEINSFTSKLRIEWKS